MDSSSSLMNVPLVELLESGDPQIRKAALDAFNEIEATLRQLKPLIRHIAIPVAISPYYHSTGDRTWFGAPNPNEPFRAIDVLTTPGWVAGRTLLLKESGKFIVARKCYDVANEYHGYKEENYGRGRRYTFHDFPPGQVIDGLVRAFEEARVRREHYVERLKKGETMLGALRQKIGTV